MSAGVGRRLWLAWLPVLLCVLDGVLTLAGQPETYWQGDYAAARELNPLFDLLLRWHPVAAVVGLGCWVVVLGAAVLLLPRSFAVVVAFAATFGHACGAASWVVALGAPGWALAVLLLIGSERLWAWSWKRAGC